MVLRTITIHKLRAQMAVCTKEEWFGRHRSSSFSEEFSSQSSTLFGDDSEPYLIPPKDHLQDSEPTSCDSFCGCFWVPDLRFDLGLDQGLLDIFSPDLRFDLGLDLGLLDIFNQVVELEYPMD